MKRSLGAFRAGRVTYEGVTWVSARKAVAELRQVTGRHNQYIPFALCFKWRRRCPHLNGRGLRARLFKFGEAGPAKLWYCEEDVLLIKQALLKRKAVRPARPPATERRPRKRRPIDTFDGVFDEPEGRRFTVSRAVKESGISKGRLRLYCEELPEAFRGPFPDGRLPSEWRRVPGSPYHRVRTVAESDLHKLKGVVAQVINPRSSRPADSHRRMLTEIYDRYRVTGAGDRIVVGCYLTRLRETGALEARQDVRAGRGNRGWSAAWLYDVRELDKLLAGRPIAEAARAFLAHGGGGADSSAGTGPPDAGQAFPPAEGRTAPEPYRGEDPQQKGIGGRPLSEFTTRLKERCYELCYGPQQLKMPLVLRKLKEEFGAKAPTDEAHVRLYARRHAKDHGLPRERRKCENP
jgi:hypothetical protein